MSRQSIAIFFKSLINFSLAQLILLIATVQMTLLIADFEQVDPADRHS
jgi:hypothetical protein